ncbi:MAG: hypothetical protein J6V57_04470 [Spirochaetaceae bacterium]|nr:hypothetical protein [Spirochaetaceae bacterium]
MKRFVLPVIILVFLFCSCGQNTGSGVSTITDEPKTWVYLNGYEYKSDYSETLTFSCPSTDVTSYTITYNGVPSQVLEYKMLDDGNGVNLLVKNTNHKNYSPSQHPDYNDSTTESHECYSLMWLGEVSESSLKMASFYLPIEGKGTACFKNEADAKEQLDTFFVTLKTDFRR